MRTWLPVLSATLAASEILGCPSPRPTSEIIETSQRMFFNESSITCSHVSSTNSERSLSSGFVSAPGDGHLYLDGKLFDFRSFNAPTLLQTEFEFEVRDLMETIAAFGTPVTRTYTLQVANKKFPGGVASPSESHILGWDEDLNDWKYNETIWRRMDRTLNLAREHGVKLIIPIINQDYGTSDSDYVGNFNDLIRHRYNIANYTMANRAVDWFTDRTMMDSFKIIITYMLNRVNTFNGIRYGDDETILAFETGNEMNWGDPKRVKFLRPPPAAWTLEVAQLIKSLAPETLVMDGSYSREGKNGTFWQEEVLSSNDVDLFSFHIYGQGDLKLYDVLNERVRAHNKTLIIGEHGFYGNVSAYAGSYQTFDCAGALIWSLRGHSEKGGFVTHGEGNNIYSYHAPGWRNQTAKKFDVQEANVISTTYNASFAVLGLEPEPTPAPGAPHTFFLSNGTHAGLSWKGASWADHYEIYGGQLQGFSLSRVSNEVQDNVESGDLFIPLYPEEPTKNITLPPPQFKGFESQDGWFDRKWCFPGTDCWRADFGEPDDDSTNLLLKQSNKNLSKLKSISSSVLQGKQEVKSKYRVLPLMYPSRRKRTLQGGWYSVRGVNADGVVGRSSRALFLKSDWMDWHTNQDD